MGFEVGAESRPTVQVRRDIAALAVEVFVACQRASFALQAAELLNFRHPCRGNAVAIAEARREIDALAEVHALLKALIPYEEGLHGLLPLTFSPAGSTDRVPPALALINGGRS